jgi:protein TonB
VFQDTPLEVILERRPPTSSRRGPLPRLCWPVAATWTRVHLAAATVGTDLSGDAAEDAQRQVEALQAEQTLLLAQIKERLHPAAPDPLQASINRRRSPARKKRKQLLKIRRVRTA